MLRDQSFVQSAPLPTKSYIHISGLIIGRLVGKTQREEGQFAKACGDVLFAKGPWQQTLCRYKCCIWSCYVWFDKSFGGCSWEKGQYFSICDGPEWHWGENKIKTSINESPAFGLSGFLSGWHFRAFRRYAFLICNKYKGMQLVKNITQRKSQSGMSPSPDPLFSSLYFVDREKEYERSGSISRTFGNKRIT